MSVTSVKPDGARGIHLHVLVIVLILFSYPIATVWLLQLGFNSSQYNLLIKAAIAGISAFALVLYRPDGRPFPSAMLPLLIFLFIFGIRLIYDVLVRDIIDIFQTRTYVFGYFFGLTLIPVLLMALRLRPEDAKPLERMMLVGLVLANLSVLFFATTTGLTSETAFGGRTQLEGTMEGTAVISPIMVSLMGAMLAAFAMGRISADRTLGTPGQVLHLGLVGLGVINLLLGGSRGPAVALGLAFLVIIYALIRGAARIGRLRTRSATWLYGGVVVAAFLYLVATTDQPIFLFERFADMLENRAGGVTEERDIIYALAWGDFLRSPLLGSSYMVSAGGYSPHNFLLEALMATGVVGGVFFMIGLFWALKGLLRMIHGAAGPEGFTLALVGASVLVASSTSGSVRDNPELWVLVAVMTILGNQRERVVAPAPKVAVSHA